MSRLRTGSGRDDAPLWEAPSLRDILTILFRHQWTILAFSCAVVLAAAAVSLLREPGYESQAKLLIRVGRESVAVDPSVSGPTIGLAQNRENELNSELGILSSGLLAEQVVERLGLAAFLASASAAPPAESPSNRSAALRAFVDNFEVGIESRSQIINLSYSGRTPELAQRTLATLIELYLQRHIEIHRSQASPDFFAEQSALLAERLQQQEERLEAFRKQHAIASMDGQKQQLLAEIGELQRTLDEINGQVGSAQARIAVLQADLGSRSAVAELSRVTGRTNPAAEEIKKRLIDLKLKEADLAARYPDDERSLVETRELIALAMRELQKETATRTEVTLGVDRNYQELQLDLIRERSSLASKQAGLRALGRELQGRRAELARLSGREPELKRLQRELDIAEREYREYVDQRQRADISAALDLGMVSNISIVQPASLPLLPVRHHRLRNLVLAALLGIFGGIGLALILEYFDDSLRSTQNVVDRLGVPVLAVLSEQEYRACT